MKVIITENQKEHLDKLRNKFNEYMFKFIDNYITNSYYRGSHDSFVYYNDPYIDNEGDDSTMIEYDSEDGRLYINYDIIEHISNIFHKTPEETLINIYKWFRKTEGISPDYLESQVIGKYYFNK